jgi:hypothetical protein
VTFIGSNASHRADKINKAFKDLRHIDRSLLVAPRGLLGRPPPEVE